MVLPGFVEPVDGVVFFPSLVCLLNDGLFVRQEFVEFGDGVAALLSLLCLLDDGLLVLHGFVELVDGVQYCAKVMQVIFDKIPGFLWLFEAILFETIFR